MDCTELIFCFKTGIEHLSPESMIETDNMFASDGYHHLEQYGGQAYLVINEWHLCFLYWLI